MNEYLWSIVIEQDLVQAAIWTVRDGNVFVISTSKPAAWGTDEDLLQKTDEALSEAEGALQAAIEGRIEDELDIPAPSRPKRGERMVATPVTTALKAAVYIAMSEQAVSKSEVARRANPGRLLQRPEQGFHFPAAPALLHAGVFVPRIGGRLNGIQIGVIEGLRDLRGILAGADPIERRVQRPGLLGAQLLEPGPFGTLPLDAALTACGAAQNLSALGRIGMLASEVVLAGGVASVRPLAIEDARRGHQEDAEERETHRPPGQFHGDTPESTRRKVRRPRRDVNPSNDIIPVKTLRGSRFVHRCRPPASGSGYLFPTPSAIPRAAAIFCVPASILSATFRIWASTAPASRSLSAWTTAGNGQEA